MRAKPRSILSLQDLTVTDTSRHPQKDVLRNVSLEVQPKEVVCLVGENGAGKSSLLLAAMGLLPRDLTVTSGKIAFRGDDLLNNTAKHHSLRGHKFALIPQDPAHALNPVQTIGQQIEEVFQIHHFMPSAERRDRCAKLLQDVLFSNATAVAQAYPHQLSPDQKQRVVIAIGLALDPKVLLADEPTNALDLTTQAKALYLFKQLAAYNQSGLLIATNNLGVVAEIADRVVVMENGVVVEDGPTAQVLSAPRHPHARMLLSATNPAVRPTRTRPQDDETMIKVQNLTLSRTHRNGFGMRSKPTVVLDDVTLAIPRGTIMGLVGASGAGKTALAKCMVGLARPDSGRVEIAGPSDANASRAEKREICKHTQIVFNNPRHALNPVRTVGKQIIQSLRDFGLSTQDAWKRTYEVLEHTGLRPDIVHCLPDHLTMAERLRVCIARTMVLEPEVLIFDNAIAGVDVSVQNDIIALLQNLRTRFGLTILFITQDLFVAAKLCDQVMVMHRGQIVESGETHAIITSPEHAVTQQLLAARPGQHWPGTQPRTDTGHLKVVS